ncbi:MAG: galactokinase, partial [Bacteroidota bacterium]
GFMYALNEQNELGLSKEEMAKIAQLTEHRIGLMCGLLDQYSVLFGEEDHALQVDFQSLEVQVQPAALEDGEWILINSRVEHNLAGDSPYNARRESCQRVVDTVAADHPHVRSLRDITPEQLQAYQPQLSEVDFRRASFVMGENRRVHEVVESFAQKDAARLGASLYQSQDEQRELYEITTSEIDTLVDFVKEEAAVWGARQTGGGFGGCVICLVKPGNLKAIERVVEKYKVATGIQAEIYPVKASQGIRRLHVV